MASQKKQCLKLGLGIQAGFYQEEGKAFQELYARTGQWDVARSAWSRLSPNVDMPSKPLGRFVETESWTPAPEFVIQ